MARGLAACGARVAEEVYGLVVEGRAGGLGGTRIESAGDHRIAMSFLVLGLAGAAPVTVIGTKMIATSFPGFATLMGALGARLDGA
jgi:3-phosphoshikimate 1-carboxyvinyltransferase